MVRPVKTRKRPKKPSLKSAINTAAIAEDEEAAEVWENIRREYIEGDRPLIRLEEIYNISRQTIARRAARQGWGPRLKKLTKGDASFPTLVKKLESALSLHISGQASFAPLNASERERAARTLSSLVRTLEKLNSLSKDKANGEDEDTDEDFPRDLAALRFELAVRLERLGAEKLGNEKPAPKPER